MHALAGTVGYVAILDEEARQKAKTASRDRWFSTDDEGNALDALIELEEAVEAATRHNPHAGPPHDAEAARELERQEAARRLADRKHLDFLAAVREWADGGDVVVLPAGVQCEDTARVEKALQVLDTLGHIARQCEAAAEDYSGERFPLTQGILLGTAAGLAEAATHLQAALR